MAAESISLKNKKMVQLKKLVTAKNKKEIIQKIIPRGFHPLK